MAVMLERWNDERMDGLEGKVERLDTKVDGLDTKVEVLDAKVDGLDERMREQRQDMKAGFERVEERFERLYRVLIFGVLTLSSAFIAGFTGLIVAGA
jgi:outer membrane murein-binding lipoprotein Lpp